MKTTLSFLTLAALPLPLLAADVTGTWKADFDTQRGRQKYTFTLKQDGTNLTGKASVDLEGEKRESELKEGNASGDRVAFVEPLKIQDLLPVTCAILSVTANGRGHAFSQSLEAFSS